MITIEITDSFTDTEDLIIALENIAKYLKEGYTSGMGPDWSTSDEEAKKEPDEWGWHFIGEKKRFDGYPTREIAIEAMENQKTHYPKVGPYPIYDGERGKERLR